jgi:hypothetical protein
LSRVRVPSATPFPALLSPVVLANIWKMKFHFLEDHSKMTAALAQLRHDELCEVRTEHGTRGGEMATGERP